MSILVAGGAGYIGSITARALLDEGREVVVYDNLSRGHRAAVPKDAIFVQGRLGNTSVLRRALRTYHVDAVMHFAAHSLVPESMTHPELYFENNVSVGLRILEAMRAENVGHIVFSSTCATFGDPKTLPIDENAPQVPTSPYGESKLMFERMLRWYHEIHGMNATVLRYFNAAGSHGELGEDHRPETHLIPILLEVANGKREKALVFGTDYDTPDGTAIRDYVHVRDLAHAHLLALAAGGRGFAHYNLGVGRGYSVKEVLESARKVTGHAIPCEDAPRRAGDPPALVSATKKIADELGFKAEFPDIDTIVESAWAWHRDHPNGYPD